MATIAERKQAAREAIISLLHQVHRVFVYLNDGEPVPLMHPRLIQLVADKGLGDIGDAGKLYFMARKHFNPGDIILVCDDDILYPKDYSFRITEGLRRYPGSVVGFHGKILPEKPIKDYRKDIKVLHCLKDVLKDQKVDLLGTGVMAYRYETIDINHEDLLRRPRNAADVHFSVLCENQNVPMMCLSHTEGWIRLSPHVDHTNDTIWVREQDSWPQIIKIINRTWFNPQKNIGTNGTET